MAHNENRREFLQKSVWVLAALPLAGVALNACTKSENPAAPSGGVTDAQNKMPDDGRKPVDENEPVAASLGYKHNAATVDVSKFPKRAGPEGQKQTCENCQFYIGKNSEWGECQVIRAGLVAKAGWCNSWAAKPA